ncbi:hypothetical protein BH24ACT15_BH24ACT15_23010 [soil metagenome]
MVRFVVRGIGGLQIEPIHTVPAAVSDPVTRFVPLFGRMAQAVASAAALHADDLFGYLDGHAA